MRPADCRTREGQQRSSQDGSPSRPSLIGGSITSSRNLHQKPSSDMPRSFAPISIRRSAMCRLAKLQPITISAAYSAASTQLAPRTVHHMHRVLVPSPQAGDALAHVAAQSLRRLRSAKVERREMKMWDVETMATALRIGAAVAGAYSGGAGGVVRPASR